MPPGLGGQVAFGPIRKTCLVFERTLQGRVTVITCTFWDFVLAMQKRGVGELGIQVSMQKHRWDGVRWRGLQQLVNPQPHDLDPKLNRGCSVASVYQPNIHD